MPSTAPQSEEPSLGELLSSIVEQSKAFARAEIDLLKVEGKQGLTKAVLALIVVMSSAVLVSIALSLIAAAIVLARHGSPALALLMAAAVHVLVAGSAVAWLVARFRKASDAAASTAAIANSPQHGSSLQ